VFGILLKTVENCDGDRGEVGSTGRVAEEVAALTPTTCVHSFVDSSIVPVDCVMGTAALLFFWEGPAAHTTQPCDEDEDDYSLFIFQMEHR
jgi:hypothetical protein